MTGLGQLICCCWYCWEVEERKCKNRSSNGVSLLPADLKTLFITTHFHRMSPPQNIQYRRNVFHSERSADTGLILSLGFLHPFSFLPLQILVRSWSDGDSSSFIMFWVCSFQRTPPMEPKLNCFIQSIITSGAILNKTRVSSTQTSPSRPQRSRGEAAVCDASHGHYSSAQITLAGL